MHARFDCQHFFICTKRDYLTTQLHDRVSEALLTTFYRLCGSASQAQPLPTGWVLRHQSELQDAMTNELVPLAENAFK